jgi:ribosomal protein S16
LDRIDYWVGVGAQPSDRVKQLIAMARKQQPTEAATATAE